MRTLISEVVLPKVIEISLKADTADYCINQTKAD